MSESQANVVESAPIQTSEAPAEASKVAAPEASSPEQKAIEKQIKKLKLKVDGQEFEEEIDLNNEEELKKHFQLSKVAQKRMQEKAELEKGLNEFVQMLRSDPKRILSHPDIGVDLKEFAKAIIDEQVQEAQKSPEQKALEAAQRELQELKSAKQKEEEERKMKELERLKTEQEEKITNDIKDALDTVGLPKNPRAVRYMAEYLAFALNNGYDLSAKEVAPLVLKQMREEYNEMLKNSPDELLEEFIDKDINSRLQKRRLSKMKKPVESPSAVKATGEDVKPKENIDLKKKTIREFFGV